MFVTGTDGIEIGGGVGVAATDATLSSVTSTHTSPGLFAATFSSATPTHTSQLNIIIDGTCTGGHGTCTGWHGHGHR